MLTAIQSRIDVGDLRIADEGTVTSHRGVQILSRRMLVDEVIALGEDSPSLKNAIRAVDGHVKRKALRLTRLDSDHIVNVIDAAAPRCQGSIRNRVDGHAGGSVDLH